jgi:hypothetical protein
MSFPNRHIYEYLSYLNDYIFENLFFPNRVVLRLICACVGEGEGEGERERERKKNEMKRETTIFIVF